ncbi:MAG: AAA family ATPase [Oscillospiraceae bacterium]|nr:AAA family ATPase [Oscillospiraceae bacterium]
MNIREAKAEIRNAIFAYFTKNEFGEYEIPIERQRPLFLVGPPGIGKTAIMEQIAQELGVGLVSYSMSHHTRQSALGLPSIVTKTYGGKEYRVSEYTMSEIIASVYDMVAETGVKEGILFLDEINCVSETLAPAMLQFLQYKTFGRHQVPAGWIVVTAGNPPEYNDSVRELDIVTLDRLRRMEIEPDYAAWKEYAVNSGVHPAITTYLDARKGDFYKIEATADGKTFVTARGWADLSSMLRIYEQRGFAITEQLVGQYLQNSRIARDFAIYYELFNKYRADYVVEQILDGDWDADVRARTKKAAFDERLSLLGLLLDALCGELRGVCEEEDALGALVPALRRVRDAAEPSAALDAEIAAVRAEIETGKRASTLSPERHRVLNRAIELLTVMRGQPGDGFAPVKAAFDGLVASLKTQAAAAGAWLGNLIRFCAVMFGVDSSGDSQEMVLLITELGIRSAAARFISRYGSDEYFAHNQNLLVYDRQAEIVQELNALEL